MNPPPIEGVFDTTVISDSVHGVTRAMELMQNVASGNLWIGFSAISPYELWLTRRLTPALEAAYEFQLSLLVEIPITRDIAIATSRALHGEPRARRSKLFRDAVIAHTALKYGVPVYTGDKRFMSYGAEIRRYEVS